MPIYLFDRTGHFITQIGDIGSGPDEYLMYSAQLLQIDEKNSQIIIYATNPKRIMYYDLKGKFIEAIPLPFENDVGLISYHQNFYLQKRDNFGRVPYTYTVLDTGFNIITKKVIPEQYSWKGSLVMPSVLFSQYIFNDRVHIRETWLNDTLYIVMNDFSFVPKYIINLGKHEVTADIRSNGNRFFKELKNLVIQISMFETDNYLFILYKYQSKLIPCYFHKKENKLIHISLSSYGIPNDFDGGLDFWPTYQNNKELVTFYDAYQLLEHKKNANKFKLKGDERSIKRFDQLIQKLEPDDNPVMIIVTLK